jgi:hypothetical protein
LYKKETRELDTTLKVLNPISATLKTANLYDTLKIKNRHYTIISYLDLSSNRITTEVKPKSDSIPIRIKFKETKESQLNSHVYTKAVKREFTKLINLLKIGVGAGLFILILRILLTYNSKKDG